MNRSEDGSSADHVTKEELQKLSLEERCLFASRNALRVFPLCRPGMWESEKKPQESLRAISSALTVSIFAPKVDGKLANAANASAAARAAASAAANAANGAAANAAAAAANAAAANAANAAAAAANAAYAAANAAAYAAANAANANANAAAYAAARYEFRQVARNEYEILVTQGLAGLEGYPLFPEELNTIEALIPKWETELIEIDLSDVVHWYRLVCTSGIQNVNAEELIQTWLQGEFYEFSGLEPASISPNTVFHTSGRCGDSATGSTGRGGSVGTGTVGGGSGGIDVLPQGLFSNGDRLSGRLGFGKKHFV